MAIVAGIDEAGFGPVLGPLVVSASPLRVADETVQACLWRRLSPAVKRKPTKKFPGLAVADSKQLYTPARGLMWLERGVLGWLGCAARPIGRLSDLLALVAPELTSQFAQYPWYDGADMDLPAHCDATDLKLRGAGVAKALSKAGVEALPARCEVLLAGRYNQLVSAMDNKAAVLLDQTARCIYWLVHEVARRRGWVFIQVDRQGGRQHYRQMLQRVFPEGKLKIIEECDQRSIYRLEFSWGRVDLGFSIKGEQRWLPIAMASMTSKYVRELLMSLLNRYWVSRVEGLKPTAGYFADGSRFAREVAQAHRQLGVARELLVRCR